MDHPTLNIKRIVGRIFGLLLLSALALLIHGYHPYAEDAEIYLPGVLKILNPSLFPANAEFFGEHAGHTLYPNLIAFSVRVTHLPLPWAASAAFWTFVAVSNAKLRMAQPLDGVRPSAASTARIRSRPNFAVLISLPSA